MDWDDRFAGAVHFYGTAPAAFLTQNADVFPPGARLLSLAEGEGRNAVWLAGRGLEVCAIEPSANALRKAEALAARGKVRVDWRALDLTAPDWPDALQARDFDITLGVFIQFAPPPLCGKILDQMAALTRPGGCVALHGFSLRQLGYASGGPRAAPQLYTLEALRAQFPGWQVALERDYDAILSEGAGHEGPAALVDFIARKPA